MENQLRKIGKYIIVKWYQWNIETIRVHTTLSNELLRQLCTTLLQQAEHGGRRSPVIWDFMFYQFYYYIIIIDYYCVHCAHTSTWNHWYLHWYNMKRMRVINMATESGWHRVCSLVIKYIDEWQRFFDKCLCKLN